MDDGLLVAALLLPPFGAAVVAFAARRAPAAGVWCSAVAMPVALAAAAAIAWRVAAGGPPVISGTLWRLDALSALLAVVVATVATLASWLGPGFDRGELAPSPDVRAYRIHANLFAGTMLVAVATSNLGVMWVALEAATVTSALLVAVKGTRAAADASWKYLIIGSVGIALAFAGTVLAFVDYAAVAPDLTDALHWAALRDAAPRLHPQVVQLAFVFLLAGFGTKAGLVPTHAWLPDAHAEAPAALSAMMSGVLLAVALYAVARWKAIVDLAAGPAFADTLLVAVGLATVAVGALLLLAQTHYKRLLAYSSIEHIGLACLGLALGRPGVFAALLHLSGHALAKGTAFLLAGRLHDRRSLLPAAAAVLALAGLPPFGLFLSEILLVRAAWTAGHPLLMAAMLVLLLVAFAALIVHLQRLLFDDARAAAAGGGGTVLPFALLTVPVALLAWMGVALPPPLAMLVGRAAEVLR